MSVALGRVKGLVNDVRADEVFGRFDNRMIFICLSLLAIGWIMIASASVDVASLRNGNPFHYVVRHGIFIVIALTAGLLVYCVPMSWWQRSGWLALALALLGLLIVLVPGIGKTVNGSTRWIGLGSINFQPSELAKIFLVAYLAGYLVRRQDEILSSWWGFAKPMMVLALAGFLLLLEPDLGAGVVITLTFLGMIFLSGAALIRFGLLLIIFAVLLFILIQVQPYRLERLVGYTDPWANQFGAGYQLTQSLIAFGRGEWLGVGLGNSVQKQFYLPEAHTDFVFAILAEEFGLLGSLVVVALFTALVLRAMKIGLVAIKNDRVFEGYFAYGLAILLGVQAFINIGVNMGLLPTKGLTLPLVSYGGSSLVISCMSIAILNRIYAETYRPVPSSVEPPKEGVHRYA